MDKQNFGTSIVCRCVWHVLALYAINNSSDAWQHCITSGLRSAQMEIDGQCYRQIGWNQRINKNEMLVNFRSRLLSLLRKGINQLTFHIFIMRRCETFQHIFIDFIFECFIKLFYEFSHTSFSSTRWKHFLPSLLTSFHRRRQHSETHSRSKTFLLVHFP